MKDPYLGWELHTINNWKSFKTCQHFTIIWAKIIVDKPWGKYKIEIMFLGYGFEIIWKHTVTGAVKTWRRRFIRA